jgi:HSP20 family protein
MAMLTRSRYGSDPFGEMQRLQSEMNRLFRSALPAAGATFPPMNVYASQDGVAITAELPGVAEEDLEISVHRDTVTLSGERKDPDSIRASEDRQFHRRERRRGRFSRTLSLPFRVEPDNVEASFEDGVLRLSLQRPESDKPRRIPVRKG